MNTRQQRQLTPWLVGWVVLAAGLWLLLLLGWGRSSHWDPAPEPRRGKAALAAAADPEGAGLEHFSETWNRPLLTDDRRPTQTAQSASGLGDFELTGVILTPAIQLALLSRKADNSANPAASTQPVAGAGQNASPATPAAGVRLAPGQHLAGGPWQLLRVEARRAVFVAAGRETALNLAAPTSSRLGTASSAAAVPAQALLEQQRSDALRVAMERLRALRAAPAPQPAVSSTTR